MYRITDQEDYRGPDSGCSLASDYTRHTSSCFLCPFLTCHYDLYPLEHTLLQQRCHHQHYTLHSNPLSISDKDWLCFKCGNPQPFTLLAAGFIRCHYCGTWFAVSEDGLFSSLGDPTHPKATLLEAKSWEYH